MKKLTGLIITITALSAVILTGCGGGSTSSGGGNNNYVSPSFLSTEGATTETKAPVKETKASTESADGSTKETVVPTDNSVITAMDCSPFLRGITLKTTLSYLADRYELPYTYNSGSKTYRWDLGDKGTVLAVHEDNDVNSIIEVSYSPYDFSTWKDARNDFSQIDTTKTYTYAEICNMIGSTGIVSKVSRTIMLPNTYHVSWYKPDGSVLNVQFNTENNETIRIILLQ